MIFEAKVLLELADLYKEQTIDNPLSRWTLAQEKEEYIIYPYYPSQFLFRGQNKRRTPCYPSLLRGLENVPRKISELSIHEQASIIIKDAKIDWFFQELEIHPIYKWAKQKKVSINRMALAQHYELPTGYIDATQSFKVAAFFATCHRSSDGVWHPITEGEGIIYKVDRNKIDPEFIEAIGLEPLPRPEEQWAWVIEVPFGEDFEKLPAVSHIEFKQNETISNHFLKMFDYGNSLFPPDPLFDIAKKIQASEIIGRDLIESSLNRFCDMEGGILKKDKDKIVTSIKDKISLVEKTPKIVSQSDIDFINALWVDRKDNFYNSLEHKVVPIYVRDYIPLI